MRYFKIYERSGGHYHHIGFNGLVFAGTDPSDALWQLRFLVEITPREEEKGLYRLEFGEFGVKAEEGDYLIQEIGGAGGKMYIQATKVKIED